MMKKLQDFMELKLLRLTPGTKNKNIVFMDVEMIDLGIKIKGIRVTEGADSYIIKMPALRVEAGWTYTPIIFSTKEISQEFLKKARALLPPFLKKEENTQKVSAV